MNSTVTVWVGTSIIYLYGTVNGVEYDFTLVGNGYWQAVVPRADDDIYVMHLEAYSSGGLEGTYDYTLHYGLIQAVTDRTANDVATGTAKGFYNYDDLNRVEYNVRILADILIMYAYPIEVVSKINWARGNIPSPSDLNRYLNNVKTLKNSFYGTTPLPESMTGLDYIGANNIEKLIREIADTIERMKVSFKICGTFAAGQTVFLPRSVI